LGCSRIAIHFDVGVVDRNEIIFGLGAEADGLTSNEARRLVADVSAISDVVGLTFAESIPRQVIRLQRLNLNAEVEKSCSCSCSCSRMLHMSRSK
jgi:arginase